MILNNKLFKLSSLCVIGTVAIAMTQVLSSDASFGLSTSSKNSEAKVSQVIGEKDSNAIISDKDSTSYKAKIGKDNKVTVEEEKTHANAVPEEEKEEFLEGPVKGVNYNDYIKYDKYKNLGIANVNQYLNV